MVELHFESNGFDPFVLKLDRWRDALEDAEPAFRELAEYQKEIVNKRVFDEEGTPETGKWAPLNAKYARWKANERPGAPTLVFDGDLRDGMTKMDKGITETWGRGMTVGVLDPIASYHQRGTGRMPARKMLGRQADKDSQAMAKIFQRFIHDRAG